MTMVFSLLVLAAIVAGILYIAGQGAQSIHGDKRRSVGPSQPGNEIYTEKRRVVSVPATGVQRPTEWHLAGKDYPGVHVAVVAGTRAGKNECVLRPAAYDILMNRPQHLIMSDPKGEEAHKLMQTGAVKGFYLYSFKEGARTSSINPIPGPREASAFFATLYKTDEGGGNKFFAQAARFLAAGLAEYSNYRSLRDIYDLLLDPEACEAAGEVSREVYGMYCVQSENTKQNIRTTALAPLTELKYPAIRNLFAPGAEEPPFHLDDPLLVVLEPPADADEAEAFLPWIELVKNHIFRLSTRGYAAGGPGSYWLMDELASIMRLASVPTMLNNGGGRGQRIMIVLQGISQLNDSLSRDAANSALSACDTQFYGRNTDPATQDYVARLSGQVRVSRRVYQDADQTRWAQFVNDATGETESRLHESEESRIRGEHVGNLPQFLFFILAKGFPPQLAAGRPWFDYANELYDPNHAEGLRFLGEAPEDLEPDPAPTAPDSPYGERQPQPEAPTPDSPPEDAPQPRACPECSCPVEDEESNCPMCGEPIPE